jgi:hypothetical protein
MYLLKIGKDRAARKKTGGFAGAKPPVCETAVSLP